jgi:hypothetical protein
MKKIKLFLSIILLFIVVTVHGQYSEKWSVTNSGTTIGCENMDNDANKEIVVCSNGGFSIIDGITGIIEYTFNCYQVSFSGYNGTYDARLVDVDNDGKFELLFCGRILSTDNYKFHLISFNGPSSVSELNSNNKVNIENYPNPFNESTKIKYNVPNSSNVLIKLFDTNGIELKTLLNEQKNIGDYEFTFNSGGLQSGIYYYQILMNNFKGAKKMLIIK